MTMKLYINDRSSAVPFVITPNKPFTKNRFPLPLATLKEIV
jgi:hypothetical protein